MKHMLFKLVGSGLTIGACAFAGLIVAEGYSARVRQLREMYHALTLFETEISYAVSSLPQALLSVSRQTEGVVSQMFGRVSELLSGDEVYIAAEAWEKALQDVFPQTAFAEIDLEVIHAFGKTLGVSDRQDQIRHLEIAQERIKRLEIEAAEQMDKNGRLWRYFGVSLGLAVVAVLL